MSRHDTGIIGKFTSAVNRRKQQLDAASNAGRRPPRAAATTPAPKLSATDKRIRDARMRRKAARLAEKQAFERSLRVGAAQ